VVRVGVISEQPVSGPPPGGRAGRDEAGMTDGKSVVAGEQPSAGESAAPTILVVDDDSGIRGVVAEALADEGYAVLQAANGAIALDVLARRMVDLILLDMRMPVMNGWEFARAYAARPAPRAPVVTMTAATDAHAWAREIGAHGILGKPFEIDHLIDIVDEFLRG
jgi:CheY-like chemotaxis protein